MLQIMKLTIQHQKFYSRGELLLRTIFGLIYIVLPHAVIMFFLSIWSVILSFIAFWSIIFTGKYPENFFDFQVKFLQWQVRLSARIMNLSDDYPTFGLNAIDKHTHLDVDYPEKINPWHQVFKLFFGIFYVVIPHFMLLFFRGIATFFISFMAFWVVLFKGKYPHSWHSFVTGYLRWQIRVALYMGFMTDVYPPFTGDELTE